MMHTDLSRAYRLREAGDPAAALAVLRALALDDTAPAAARAEARALDRHVLREVVEPSLGVVTDVELSQRHDVAITAVWRWRTELGRDPATYTRPEPEVLGKEYDEGIFDASGELVPTLPADVLARLGHEPDRAIHRETGIPLLVLRRVRRHRGIPAYSGPRTVPGYVAELGTRPDTEISRAWGVPLSTVTHARTRRGIPSYDPPVEPPPYLDELGTRPDTQIARTWGASASTVRAWRVELEIPAYRRPAPEPEPEPPPSTDEEPLSLAEIQDAERDLRRRREVVARDARHHEALHRLRVLGIAWHDGPDEAGRGATWRPARK